MSFAILGRRWTEVYVIRERGKMHKIIVQYEDRHTVDRFLRIGRNGSYRISDLVEYLPDVRWHAGDTFVNNARSPPR